MRKMCILIGTGSQVSDVAHWPLVNCSYILSYETENGRQLFLVEKIGSWTA